MLHLYDPVFHKKMLIKKYQDKFHVFFPIGTDSSRDPHFNMSSLGTCLHLNFKVFEDLIIQTQYFFITIYMYLWISASM